MTPRQSQREETNLRHVIINTSLRNEKEREAPNTEREQEQPRLFYRITLLIFGTKSSEEET